MEISILNQGPWYVIDNVEEVSSPALLIYPDRIKENISKMIKIAGNTDCIRPHVKSHKMAEITSLQMEAGIYKFKCATISEAEMLAECGVKEILLAMQPVGPNVQRFFILRQKFSEIKFSCIVDSVDIIMQLAEMAANTGLVTDVWIDINNGMNRTGLRPDEKAFSVIQKISAIPMIRIEGLHVYDGHINESDILKRQKISNDAFAPVLDLRDRLISSGMTHLKIVAGGSSTFPFHALRKDTECSPGTLILWDYGYSRLFGDMDFMYAAILLTRIISKPDKDLICIDLGHKAVASEMPQPRILILNLEDYTIISQNEEHMVIRTPRAEDLNVGDVFYAVPWHVCPTVDRYDSASVVTDRKVQDQWNVVARKRKITI